MEIKIVTNGADLKIKILLKGIPFYSSKGFDTREEAEMFLQKHGLHEGFINLTMW